MSSELKYHRLNNEIPLYFDSLPLPDSILDSDAIQNSFAFDSVVNALDVKTRNYSF